MKSLYLLVLTLALRAGLASAALEPPVLRLSLETEPATLDWNDGRSSTHRLLLSFLMRGLLRYDAASAPVCDLCASYKLSPAGDTFEFALKNEEWSDGTQLTAQHFVDGFKRLQDPGNRFVSAERFKMISSVRALAPDRLEIKVSRSPALVPHLLTTEAAFPIRKELFAGSKDLGVRHLQTATLGPYGLAAWEKGKRLVIEGNPRYKGTRPVYRVELILGARAAQVRKFKDGKLDILSNPTTEDLVQLPGQKIEVSPYLATRLLIFNFRKQVAADVRLRRAVLFALDRARLPGALRNGERKTTGLIPPGLLGYRELPLASGDNARALKEKHWQRISLDLLLPATESDRTVGRWLAEQLAPVGIQLRLVEQAEVARATSLESGSFDLALINWRLSMASPLDILAPFSTESRGNWGRFTHVAFDGWVEKLLSQKQDGPEAAGWVDKATQILETQEVGAIPLGYPTQPFLLGKRVVSFAITPFGDPDLIRIQLKH